MVYFSSTLVAKRLEMLREIVPRARLMGFLTNPKNPISGAAGVQEAARSIGQVITVLTASTADEIGDAFASATQRGVGALVVDGDAFFNSRRSASSTSGWSSAMSVRSVLLIPVHTHERCQG